MIFLTFDKHNAIKATFYRSDGSEIKPIRYNEEDTIYFLQTQLRDVIIAHDSTIIFTEQDLTMPPPWPPTE